MFITFEGIDGCGKTTQVQKLVSYLKETYPNKEVIATREPGGTIVAEKIRDVALHNTMDVATETLLMFAARNEHIKEIIKPALARGAIVICDRFTDSTYAYQGAKGMSEKSISKLQALVQDGFGPDLTIWLELPPTESTKRIEARNGVSDKFEKETEEYKRKLARIFFARYRSLSNKPIVRVDADQTPDKVHEEVIAVVASKMGK